MDQEIEQSVRIVSGTPVAVEHQLQQLLKSYGALVWNFLEVKGEVHVTVVLVHEREMRKAQLAQMRGVPGMRQ